MPCVITLLYKRTDGKELTEGWATQLETSIHHLASVNFASCSSVAKITCLSLQVSTSAQEIFWYASHIDYEFKASWFW